MTANGGRSVFVGLVASLQRAREPHGRNPVLRWALTRLGRSPDRFARTAECRQCGDSASVKVLRLGARRARYWCQHCGAVVAVFDLAAIRPATELRPPVAAPMPVPVPGSAPGAGPGTDGAVATDLREVMPAAMLRWITGRYRRPLTMDRLTKPVIYQLYARWDAHLTQAGPGDLVGLAAHGEPPPTPGLPAFAVAVKALHDGCYRSELAVATLLGSVPAPAGSTPAATGSTPAAAEIVGAALLERVEHARRWLALHGTALCWIVGRSPDGQLATPDRNDLEAAIIALRSGVRPEPDAGRAVRAALFGTHRGPMLRKLLAVYSAADLVAAVEIYLNSGQRPLHRDVLARLAAPPGTRIGSARDG